MSSSKKCFVLRFRDRSVLVFHDQCPHCSVSILCKHGAALREVSNLDAIWQHRFCGTEKTDAERSLHLTHKRGLILLCQHHDVVSQM
jgi:hypothetical protein